MEEPEAGPEPNEDFVNELGNHLKIAKVCKIDKLNDQIFEYCNLQYSWEVDIFLLLIFYTLLSHHAGG